MQAIDPCQIALLAVIRFLFPRKQDNSPGKSVPLALYTHLLDHVYELCAPAASLEEFQDGFKNLAGTSEQSAIIQELCDSVTALFVRIASTRSDGLVHLFADCRALLPERDAEDIPNSVYQRPPIERRSPIGLYIRGIYLNYSRKPYDHILKLIDKLLAWSHNTIKGDVDFLISLDDQEVDVTQIKDWSGLLGPSETFGEKGKQVEDSSHTQRGLAYDDYISARNAGHVLRAQNALRRFFDFRQPGSVLPAARNLNQSRALYNLAHLHFDERGYVQARGALDEAIRIARQNGDRDCLGLCLSLEKRLDFNHPEGALPNKTSFPPSSASSELWLVKEGLRTGQPVPQLLFHLYRSKALLPNNTAGLDFEYSRYVQTWEAIASELWNLLGSTAAADVHRSLAEECALNIEIQYSLLASRAIKMAHNGDYDGALSALLMACMPDIGDVEHSTRYVKASLTLQDLRIVQSAVWQVWKIKAERIGSRKLLDRISQLSSDNMGSQPPLSSALGVDQGKPEEQDFVGSEANVRFLLNKAKKLIDLANPAPALQPLLKALSISSLPAEAACKDDASINESAGKGLVALHLTAQVMLADVEIWFKASEKGLASLTDLWPEIFAANDKELHAYAYWTHARCLIASAKNDDAKLRLATSLLFRAREVYASLQAIRLQSKVLSDLATVFDMLGESDQRDRTAEQWSDLNDSKQRTLLGDSLLQELCEMESWLATWSSEVANMERP